jgi:rhodanese-related sulfurtransferase
MLGYMMLKESMLEEGLPVKARCGGKAIVLPFFLVGLGFGFATLLSWQQPRADGEDPAMTMAAASSASTLARRAWQPARAGQSMRAVIARQPVQPLGPAPRGLPSSSRTGPVARATAGTEFKKAWPDKYRSLIKNGLKPVSGEKAIKMAKEGAILLDVRVEDQFEEESFEGAINIPMNRPIEGSSPQDTVKKLIYASLAIPANERNTDFVSMAREKLPTRGLFFFQDKPIIIIDVRGGKLEMPSEAEANSPGINVFTDSNRYTEGFVAASYLYEAGFKNLYILDKGYGGWWQQQNPTPKPEYWQAFFIR